jgi:WD40 repeat protein
VVGRLVAALVRLGKDVWIDLEDIPPAADWRDRVLAGVEAANALIFVLSPDSATSEICREELDRAVALNKRLLPVVRRDVPGASVPAPLQRLNWISLRAEDDFDQGLALVVEALETDLAWRDTHTRLASRAGEWLAHDRDASFLLRGSDLRAAEDWLADQAGHQEAPTAEQTQYTLAGRRAAARRQRTTLAAVATALVIAVALAVTALWQRQLAVDREKTARSRELAASALAVLPRDPELSALLAAQGIRRKPTAQAEDALRRAIGASYVHATLRHGGPVESAVFDPARGRVATASLDGSAGVWDVRSARRLLTLRGGGGQLWGVAFSPHGAHIVTTSSIGTGQLWSGRTGRRLATLKGHVGNVHSPAFSPDGTTVVTAGSDQTARLWDVAGGRLLHTLIGHRGIVFNAAFGSAGRRVVTSGEDGTARIWSAATGRMLVTVRVPRGWVNRAAFSPDGRLIATADQDHMARAWDARTGAQVAVMRGHGDSVLSVAFSRDSKRVVTASADDSAMVWDVRTGRRLAIMRGHTQTVNRAVFDPTGKLVATSSADRSARVWDAGTGAQVGQLLGHADDVGGVTFSPDGRMLLTSSDDGTARVWRVPNTAGRALHGDGRPVAGAVFSPRGDRAATWSGVSAAWVWDTRTGRRLRVFGGSRYLVTAAAFSPDGRRLIASTVDPAGAPLHVWRLAGGRLIAKASGPTLVGPSLSLSRDGRRATTVSLRHPASAQVWDTVTGRRLADLRPHTADVLSATLSPDGRRVVTTGSDRRLRAWNVGSERTLASLRHWASVLNPEAVFSPDGAWVAITSADSPIPVWDLHARKPRRSLRPRALVPEEVVDLAVSREGLIAAASRDRDGVVRVFDAASGSVVSELRGTPGEVRAVAFSTDGRWVATAGLDGTGRVWEAVTGRLVQELRGHSGPLTAVAFSPDARHVITAAKDGTARIHDCPACLPLRRLVAEVPNFVTPGRTFTTAERARYVP